LRLHFLYNKLIIKKERGVAMAQTVNVNFRLDEDIKKNMEQVCSDLELSMSAAFTIFPKNQQKFC
jgi:hypothetical protein